MGMRDTEEKGITSMANRVQHILSTKRVDRTARLLVCFRGIRVTDALSSQLKSVHVDGLIFTDRTFRSSLKTYSVLKLRNSCSCVFLKQILT